MTTQNLTDWFNLDEQKPWEPGVYEVETESLHNGYSYWDGGIFNWVGNNIEYAIGAFERGDRGGSGRGTIRWRGLSSAPSAKPAPEPKPKARGNRKVTRYVVMDREKLFPMPAAVFKSKKLADAYAEKMPWSKVERVRFRTPEAG